MGRSPSDARTRTRRNFLAVHGTCHYCGAEANTIDHIVPRARGGYNAVWNYAPSCQLCNEDFRDAFPKCWCNRCCNAVACTVVAPLMPRQRLMEMTEW